MWERRGGFLVSFFFFYFRGDLGWEGGGCAARGERVVPIMRSPFRGVLDRAWICDEVISEEVYVYLWCFFFNCDDAMTTTT